MEVPHHVLTVCRRLESAGFPAYIVGGAIRDLLLGIVPRDWDVATSAGPAQIRTLYPDGIPTGEAFGTMTIIAPEGSVHITAFRREGAYSDARRPDRVSFDADLTTDLARRDFTVNAMAYHPAGDTLIDPWGGWQDLQQGVLRAVGHPGARFAEDALRMLRAVRFAVTLGMDLAPEIPAQIKRYATALERISAERICAEWDHILLAPDVVRGMVILQDTQLLSRILPQGFTVDMQRGANAMAACRRARDLRLAALARAGVSPPQARDFLAALVKGLKYGNRVTRASLQLLEAVRNTSPLNYKTDGEVRRWLHHVQPRRAGAVLQVWLAVETTGNSDRAAAEHTQTTAKALRRRVWSIRRRRDPLFLQDLAVSGEDLMNALGWSAGPEVGALLTDLLHHVLENPADNKRERLLELAQRRARMQNRSANRS